MKLFAIYAALIVILSVYDGTVNAMILVPPWYWLRRWCFGPGPVISTGINAASTSTTTAAVASATGTPTTTTPASG